MKYYTNIEDNENFMEGEDLNFDEDFEKATKKKSGKTNAGAHNMKIASNDFVKKAKENRIPALTIYYDPKNGYKYNGIFPEEIGSEELKSQYGRFYEFMRVCLSFNQDDYVPVVKCGKKNDKSDTSYEED